MLPEIIGHRVFVCTGEPSGDEFAGLMVKQYKEQGASPDFIGIAGDTALASGISVLMGYDRMMAFGLQNSIRSLIRHLGVYRQIARLLYREKPGTFIAIAYPGVNLFLCRHARKLGCKTIFFMPPQIWAWGDFRKYFIRKWVDVAVSVFPFEYEYYRNRGIKTEYFIHPALEKLAKIKRSDQKKRIGFMPGSRPGQIKRHMAVINGLISEMRRRYNGYEYCIIVRPESAVSVITNADRIISDNRHQAMKDCDLVITTSGTAALETFFMNVRQIFFHIPSFIDMHFFRYFIHTAEYNLANLFAGKQSVPTFVSRDRLKILGTVLDIIDTLLKKAEI